ncbi:MAG: LapA family protein [Alphaproteobacteria bacterium]
MAYITLLITIPLTIFAGLFSLSNTGIVTLGLWPFENKVDFGVNIFGLAMLGIGFLLGALFVWIQYQKIRLKLWQESRKTARLEKELDSLRQKPETAATPTTVPAIVP